jgi:O-antigen ligase
MEKYLELILAKRDRIPHILFGLCVAFALCAAVNRSVFYALFISSFLWMLVLFIKGEKGLWLSYLFLVFLLPINLFIPRALLSEGQYASQYFLRILLFLGVFAFWMLLILRREIKTGLTGEFIVKVLIIFLGMEMVSFLILRDRSMPFSQWLTVSRDFNDQGMSLLMFFLTVSLCRTKGSIEKAVIAFAASAPLVMGFGFLEKLSGSALFSIRDLALSEFTQVTSTFHDPNFLSRYAAILILLFCPFYLYGGFNRAWSLILALSSFILMVFTRSTSGFVSLILGITIIFINRRQYMGGKTGPSDYKKALSNGMVWYVLLILLPVAIMPIHTDITNYFNINMNKLSSFEGSARYNMDMAAAEMFKASPVFGVGFSKFSSLYFIFNPLYNAWGAGGDHIIIHNSFMKVASEMGILGLIPLFIMYIYFAKAALLDARKIKDDFLRRLQLSLGAIWIALIVNSLAYFKFFEDPKVWFIAGLILAIQRAAGSEAAKIG